jgi:hypothetical protein
MSYSSRVYRQRNPKVQEEKGKAFFPGKEARKAKNSNSFFQVKGSSPVDTRVKQADSIAGNVANQMTSKQNVQRKKENIVRRQSSGQPEEKKADNANTGEMEKDKMVQKKMADQEKEREVNIPKQGDPLKEKETTIQKKGEDMDKKKDINQKKEAAEQTDEKEKDMKV